jgi:Lar family restriction alleviation protein
MDSIEKLEQRLKSVEKRLAVLEGNHGRYAEEGGKILETDLVLPEADIGGLHFNEQKVHGVFELKEDGNYYSRDILFNSARDTEEGTDRDLLSEYLESQEVKDTFIKALTDALIGFDDIRIFLPEENQGVKKDGRASCWYWLRPRYAGSAANFCISYGFGNASHNNASAVGGCVPAFRVWQDNETAAKAELKPCPFCGNDNKEEFAFFSEQRSISGKRRTVYNAACSCGAMGPDGHTKEEAVERWNRRIGEE